MPDPAARPERKLAWLRRARKGMSLSLRWVALSLGLLLLEVLVANTIFASPIAFAAALLWLVGSMGLYFGLLAACFLRYSLWSLLAMVFVAAGSLALFLQQENLWKLLGLAGFSGCGVALAWALHAADPDLQKGKSHDGPALN
ncbi:MAG: hypothetical protein KIS92_18100 [Planctomycetota bacterium]|nr:hypothetical protein [Planctomycetota bacterium]